MAGVPYVGAPEIKARWTVLAVRYHSEIGNPGYSVAHTIGFLKGKSVVRIHRNLLQERRMTGLHFWSTGYCVSTVGLDEGRIREYIREQEQLDAGQGDLDVK